MLKFLKFGWNEVSRLKIIYIDSDYKCHVNSGDGLTAVETNVFDGKCDTYIEGYRFVPAGSKWTRSDGVEFTGEMISPWKDWKELDDVQRVYERELLVEYSALVAELSEVYEENAD